MKSLVKSPRDVGAGLLFFSIGSAANYFGKGLSYGSASRIGPGYFPAVISWGLIGIGILLVLRGLTLKGAEIEPPQLRALFGVLFSILVFGVLIGTAGLPLSVIALVIIASLARPRSSITETALLAVGLAALAAFTFIYILSQPLSLGWTF